MEKKLNNGIGNIKSIKLLAVHFFAYVNLPSKNVLNNSSRFGSNKRLSLYMIRSNILFILASFRQLVKKVICLGYDMFARNQLSWIMLGMSEAL